MERNAPLEEGDVVQLAPSVGEPMIACCMMTVASLTPFGAHGYVHLVGQDNAPGGILYCSARWEDMELVGKAVWTIAPGANQ